MRISEYDRIPIKYMNLMGHGGTWEKNECDMEEIEVQVSDRKGEREGTNK